MSKRKWTKQRVIRSIQALHRRGVPVGKIWRKDRSLCITATRLFGTWREALLASGLQPERQRWSKERVISEIQARYPVCCPRYRLWKEDTYLAGAAKRHFGSLHDALVAAGFREGKRHTQRSWTKQQILEAIQSWHRQGLSLTAVWRENKMLYAIAKRHFGRWRQALEAAGFTVETPKTLTRDEIVQEIQSRYVRGLPLEGVFSADPRLYDAARRQFGRWRDALAAAGFEPKPRRSWTKQSVIDAIRSRHERGLPLSRVWADDKRLFRAAVRKFGGWAQALRTAGLKPKPRRRWSKQRVVAELQAWHRQSDDNLRTVDPALAGAAVRLLGSVAEAMEAAGIEVKRGRWTNQQVIEAIQDRFVQGHPINIAGFGDRQLAGAAKRRFGSWAAAVAAAGLSEKYTPPPVIRIWSKEAVLDAVQAWHAQGRILSNVSKQDTALYNAAKKHFGGWRAAVIAAGLEPTRKQWSQQRVIEEIRIRRRRGEPFNIGIVLKQDAPLAGAAIRLFGNWRAAVAAAKEGTIARKTA